MSGASIPKLFTIHRSLAHLHPCVRVYVISKRQFLGAFHFDLQMLALR